MRMAREEVAGRGAAAAPPSPPHANVWLDTRHSDRPFRRQRSNSAGLRPTAKHTSRTTACSDLSNTPLVIVDQPANIGALPLAVARDAGCLVAYLPGLTMRRIADLYPGEAKTDARDAFIIADAARTMPHTLRALATTDETVAELDMLAGFDDDLAGEVTRTANRLRGLLTQIHRSLERVLGPRIQHPAVLTILERYGSPALVRKAGRRRLVTLIRPEAPRMAERLVEDIFTALDEQTSSSQAPRPPAPSCPASPDSYARTCPNAPPWNGRSPPCWRPTLFHSS